MPTIYEYEDGELVREGYCGEGTCPVCGYPVTATYYSDGAVELGSCYACNLTVGL